MNNLIIARPDSLFSVGAIEEELKKIFRDPHFLESAILKKFLSFIVQETLHGRSNCLKEYTIAINVLEKPLTFNPQENGIVRIHAGRLRRALNQYYNEEGHNDQIVISIPKGKYVPVFANRTDPEDAAIIEKDFSDFVFETDEMDNVILAVLPFVCITKTTSANSFTEGLCMQMSSMLTQLEHVSVIAYQATKNLVDTHPDYKEMASAIGFNYIITGGTQFQKDKVRVNIQLIDCMSYRQIWCESFERKITRSDFFDVQDDISQHILSHVEEMLNRKNNDQKLLMHS